MGRGGEGRGGEEESKGEEGRGGGEESKGEEDGKEGKERNGEGKGGERRREEKGRDRGDGEERAFPSRPSETVMHAKTLSKDSVNELWSSKNAILVDR